MSWDDDDFGQEYYKFSHQEDATTVMYDYAYVAYLEIHWDTIRKELNDWNKNRMRVNVQEIKTCKNTPFNKDEVIENSNLVLDMGARLFNTIKKYKDKKPKYLRIVKIYNPRDKFDTYYFAEPYKLFIKPMIKPKAGKKK